MSRNRLVTALAVLGGVALVAVAVVYFASPAHALPAFFPGHADARAAGADQHQVRHGFAALVLAFACFVIAWFAGGGLAERGATA